MVTKTLCAFPLVLVSKIAELDCVFFLLMSASTHDQDVFSFHSDERFCNGFEEVLSRYREIVPCLRLAGVAFVDNINFIFLLGSALLIEFMLQDQPHLPLLLRWP